MTASNFKDDSLEQKKAEEVLCAKYPKFYDAAFGESKNVHNALLTASLFIMSFECLKDFIEDHFRSFFSNGVETDKSGRLVYIPSKEYPDVRAKYEQLYKGLAKKLLDIDTGHITTFQVACAWFHDMEAITDEDMKVIISSSKMRNDFAHELYKWIFDDNLPHLDKNFVNAPISLYFKISNWWIRNIEQSILPENYEQFSEEDLQSAAVMNFHILQLLIRRILPD